MFPFHPDHIEIQVGPVEAGDGDGRIAQSENSDNIATHPFRRGRSECGNRRTGRQCLQKIADTKI